MREEETPPHAHRGTCDTVDSSQSPPGAACVSGVQLERLPRRHTGHLRRHTHPVASPRREHVVLVPNRKSVVMVYGKEERTLCRVGKTQWLDGEQDAGSYARHAACLASAAPRAEPGTERRA